MTVDISIEEILIANRRVFSRLEYERPPLLLVDLAAEHIHARLSIRLQNAFSEKLALLHEHEEVHVFVVRPIIFIRLGASLDPEVVVLLQIGILAMLRLLAKRRFEILAILRALLDRRLVEAEYDALVLERLLDHLRRRICVGIRVVKPDRSHHLVRTDMDIDLAVDRTLSVSPFLFAHALFCLLLASLHEACFPSRQKAPKPKDGLRMELRNPRLRKMQDEADFL